MDCPARSAARLLRTWSADAPTEHIATDLRRTTPRIASRSGCIMRIDSAPAGVIASLDERLSKRAVEREVDLGNAGRRREACARLPASLPPSARMSSSVRASQRMTQSPLTRSALAVRRTSVRTPPRKGRAAARRSGRCCWRTRRAPSSRPRQKRRCRDVRRCSWMV